MCKVESSGRINAELDRWCRAAVRTLPLMDTALLSSGRDDLAS